ncbi:hypothetical protein ACFWSF_18275 [Streptomyces sp. NPDC058611]|uniref:hypothetical protein n=1 Tax=unclassified Streptomyces TaxID=2593676 RepID=UPI003652C7E2
MSKLFRTCTALCLALLAATALGAAGQPPAPTAGGVHTTVADAGTGEMTTEDVNNTGSRFQPTAITS